MRRNNNVFLVGEIRDYAERTITVNDRQTPLIDLLLQTDKFEISGEHKVIVRGQQAEELRYFLQAAAPELPQLMVLGWLRSGVKECVVMAERVTVLASPEVRKAAIAAIKQARNPEE